MGCLQYPTPALCGARPTMPGVCVRVRESALQRLRCGLTYDPATISILAGVLSFHTASNQQL